MTPYVPVQASYERRGTCIYGEDKGPGTAPLVADCGTVEAAEIILGHLQILLLERDNARHAADWLAKDLP